MWNQNVSARLRRVILPAAFTTIALATAGCGLNQFGAGNAAQQSLAGSAIQGQAHGGYFPVTDATVTLWYPGVTGYGSAPTQLGSSVTTDASGNFSFPANSYTCPAADMPVYLTLTGGNPGLTTTGNWNAGTGNSYLALMAAIGPCSGAGSQYAWINEVTTAATVFATAQFTSAAQAANGISQVNSYTVTAGGGAYTDSTLTVSFSGGGCSTEPTAAALPVTAGSVIPGTYITTSTGVGCSSTPAVTLSGAGGAGALASANFSNIGDSGSVGGTAIGSVSGTTASNGGNIGAPIGTVTSGVLNVTNPLAYTGLKNAFATVDNLVNVATGVSGPATITNATVETAKLNTIANILASCVQTDGVAADSALCSNLAAVSPTGVTPTGHTVPVDTVQIATYMALSPTTNVSTVYNNFTTPQPMFQTALTAPPFDWTIAISYWNLGLSAAQFAAVDTQGQIWLGNGNTPNGLIGITPLGQLVSGSPFLTSGYSSPTGIIVDPRGHVWSSLRSSTYNSISDFDPLVGTQTTYAAQVAGSTKCAPSGIAINPNLDVLYTCSTITSPQYPLNGLQNTGTTALPVYDSTSLIGNVSTSGSTSPTAYPTAIASDTNGNIWSPSYVAQPNSVVEMIPASFSGTPSLPASYTAMTYTSPTTNGSSPTSMTVDHTGSLLYAASGIFDKVTYSGGTYTHSHATSTTSGGLNGARYAVLDGAGDLWVANSGATTINSVAYSTVSEINNAGVQITPTITAGVNPGGYTHNYGTPRGIVVDGSGNVWAPNYTGTTSVTNQITEIVGIAVPVYTPLGAAPLNNRLGTLP